MYITQEIKKQRLNNTYREPIDTIYNQIKKENKNLIILQGPRESGKTTTLYNIENRSINEKDKSIYTRFIQTNPTSELLTIHYYELTLLNILLNYIKDNYPHIYPNFQDFINIANELNEDYKQNSKKGLKKYLSTGKLTSLVISKIKRILEINKLTLLIDDFDIREQILSKYLNIFDQIVITSSKPIDNIPNSKVIEINYGEYPQILKEIFKIKIDKFSEKNINFKTFPLEKIDENLYQYLIENSKGNIGILLRTLYSVSYNWTWNEPEFNIPEGFELYLNEQQSHLKRILK